MIVIKSNIFLPKKINVGFVNRNDTYTKKLAYIIYTDEKGVLRKESSWNGWRDKSIPNIEFDNIPTSGFVLNKKAGDYCSGWDHRQAYVRVYDPRDFEFEVTVENLLYILENSTSTKGKGLESQFVYGWSGKDLILIPTESPDYIEMAKYNEIVHNNTSVKAKDLIIGATYQTKDNEEWVYMGKFDYYGWRSNDKKQFWFYDNDSKTFTSIKSLANNKIINVVDINCCDNYADLFDELELLSSYSPVDESKIEYEDYSLDYFKEIINEKILLQDYWWAKVHIYCVLENEVYTYVTISRKDGKDSNVLKAIKKSKKMEKYNRGWYNATECEREVEYDETICESESIEEIFNQLKPQYKNIYLKNGKLRGGSKNNE